MMNLADGMMSTAAMPSNLMTLDGFSLLMAVVLPLLLGATVGTGLALLRSIARGSTAGVATASAASTEAVKLHVVGGRYSTARP